MTEQQTHLDNGWQLSADAIAFYREHPALFAEQQLNVKPYKEQVDLLNAVIRDAKWTSWVSGHGPGKSTALSLLGLTFIYLFWPTKVVATAPKREQLYDILWPEAKRILDHSMLNTDFEWQKTKISLKGHESDSVMLARTSATPESLAGQHSENILYIVDEASGVDERTFETIEGSQTGGKSLICLAGNGTQPQGYFFDSHHKDKAQWYRIATSVEDHPNVLPEYAQRIAKKWGKGSDVYRVRVEGKFPRGDPHTFIPLDRVEAAILRGISPEGPISIGVDVARFGDDRTVCIGRSGGHVFSDHVDLASSAVDETAGAVIHYLQGLRHATGNQAIARIQVDDSGVGGGVTDILRRGEQQYGYVVHPCNFGGAGNDEYDDEATIMWANLRDCIDLIELPDIEDLVGEVSTRRFYMTATSKFGSRIKLESKKDYKARALRSPDFADALVLCCAEGDKIDLGDMEVIQSTTDWG